MVIAAARTGRERSNRNAVIKTDQEKSVILDRVKEELRMLIIVVIKLTAPRIEETPAK